MVMKRGDLEREWKMIPPGIWYLVFPLFLYATHLLFRLGLKHTVCIKDLGLLSGNYCVSNSVCLGLSVKWKFSWRSSEVSAAMGLCGSLINCPIDKRELEKIPSVLGGHLTNYLEGFYKRWEVLCWFIKPRREITPISVLDPSNSYVS